MLRKDFMIDPYQVWEARAAGADAILLIAECLELDAMVEMRDLALELGMSTLLEVHDEENFTLALREIDLDPGRRTVLGINSRDLPDEDDLANAERLVATCGQLVDGSIWSVIADLRSRGPRPAGHAVSTSCWSARA